MRVADNTVGSVLDLYRSALNDRYGVGEARAMIRMVIQEHLGWDLLQLDDHRKEKLSEAQLLRVYTAFKRLSAGEPLQYILGHVWFMGMRLRVGPGVLIPRPETEELVDHIINNGRSFTRFVDVGTGSGCIAIALKRSFPRAEGVAIDVSPDALLIATANAAAMDVQLDRREQDVLHEDTLLPEACDLVVSNPPYVPRGEEVGLADHVRYHEPHLALFVDDADPLLFYRAIAHKALKALIPGGELWFEGHFRYAEQVGELLGSLGYRNVRVIKDLSGTLRFICAVR